MQSSSACEARRVVPASLIDGSSEARSRATDRIERIILRLRWHPPRAAGHAAIRSAAGGARRGCEIEGACAWPSFFVRTSQRAHKGDGSMRTAERGKLKVRRAGSGQPGKARCQRARRGRVQPRSRIRVHVQRVCIRALAPRVVLSVSRLQPAPVDRDLPMLPAPSRILHYPTCLPDIQAVNELISASLFQGGRNAGPCQTQALGAWLHQLLGADASSELLAHCADGAKSAGRACGWRRCEISHLRCHRRAEARAAPQRTRTVQRGSSERWQAAAATLSTERFPPRVPFFAFPPSMPPWKLGSGCAFPHNLRLCAGTADRLCEKHYSQRSRWPPPPLCRRQHGLVPMSAWIAPSETRSLGPRSSRPLASLDSLKVECQPRSTR